MQFVFTYNISLVWWEIIFRSNHWRCSVKKGVLKNFAKLTGKHLCLSLFFNKVASRRSATLLKKKLWHRCFPVDFAKFLRTPFFYSFAKFLRTPFVRNTSERLLLWTTASETSNTKYLGLIKRSKVQEKNKSCKRALNFDQWKTFSENYKPMRVWLWLVYKFTENCQIYRLFSEFIQTKKKYPTSLDKIRILTR